MSGHVEDVLRQARAAFGEQLDVTFPAADVVRLAIPGEEVHVSQTQPVCWPTLRADVPARLMSVVVAALYPKERSQEQWLQAVLALGRKVAHLEAALVSAGQYTDVRVAELERRLVLLQDTCDSACAQVAQLSDEVGSRRRRRGNAEADGSADDPAD